MIRVVLFDKNVSCYKFYNDSLSIYTIQFCTSIFVCIEYIFIFILIWYLLWIRYTNIYFGHTPMLHYSKSMCHENCLWRSYCIDLMFYASFLNLWLKRNGHIFNSVTSQLRSYYPKSLWLKRSKFFSNL